MDLEQRILAHKWFYRFPLPSGRYTETFVGDDKLKFHDDRFEMVSRAVSKQFGDDYSMLSCLDIGCHEGYFAFQMARKGFKSVTGVEARLEHVEKADMIRQVHDLKNLSYQAGNAVLLDGLNDDGYDLTLMLGIVYHLDNPIGALRRAAELTKRLLVVETQIMPNMTGVIDWGSHEHCKHLMGVWGIINEGMLIHSDGTTGIALVPSLEGLIWVLHKLGFNNVEVVDPDNITSVQLKTGKRVVLAAWR